MSRAEVIKLLLELVDVGYIKLAPGLSPEVIANDYMKYLETAALYQLVDDDKYSGLFIEV